MASMRNRVTAIAACGTLLALTLAAVVLHVVLARSLSSQLDEVLVNRALDVADGITFNDALDNSAFPLDGITFIGILEPATDGSELALDVHNDDEPDANEVDDIVSSPTFVFGEAIDASLPSLDLIDGDTNMRLVAVEVEPDAEIVVVAQSLDRIDTTIAEVDRFSFVSVPLLTAAVALLVWLLAGRALDPVETMRREVEQIARTSDLDRRVQDAGQTSELDRLGATMNSMLSRLAEGQDRERRFSSDAAHELRSPLASMAAQLDVDQAHPESADHQHTAQQLRQETERLRRLVDDLLLLARSNHPGEREHRLLDLDDLLAVAAASVPHRTAVSVHLPTAGSTQVRGDRVELERLFTNLLSNATRHANSTVDVSTQEHGGVVLVTIDDDGHGIPAAERERVFQRFTRLDDARSRDRGGSGLGLALAHDIALRHHGTLTADEARLGGASLRLELPSA